MPVITIQRDACDYESLTITGVAGGVALTAEKVFPTNPPRLQRASALMTLEAGQIRYRYDGVAPTSSEGHLMEVGDTLVFYGAQNLTKFRAINTGTNGTLKVTYHA